MSKLLDIKQECEDVSARNGYYIPPYRLKLMGNAADKVTKALVGLGNELTYTEMLIVLRTVTRHINEILESKKETKEVE